MKVYTKTGDKGETSLLGGTRVSKDDIRIETYGTVDELNSHVGLIRDQEMDSSLKEVLIEIQDRLFTLGSHLASDPEKTPRKLPGMSEDDITLLEQKMDEMNEELEPMRSFVLPGGHTTVSYCHIARCVCRRAERLAIRLKRESYVDSLGIRYLNRLSDYLFVLSRRLTQDLGATEIPWEPRI
ncbi:cob(I)yrinic acid a,c-diamide adenosyltransferase [bacterium SCSIO 12741]|nr:cob(I)yrinic acid a,c-diamide adenosyltransferase [bacterium SCSIO 12741]